MPWINNNSLPQSVKNNLPQHAQSIWREAANSSMKNGANDSTASKVGWGAVRGAGYHKDNSGKWVKDEEVEKSEPGVDSVMTPQMNGWQNDSNLKILKALEDKQIVIGVVAMSDFIDGTLYFDAEGDHIPPEELINIAEYYMLWGQKVDLNHTSMDPNKPYNPPIEAKVVYSFVTHPDILNAFGLTSQYLGTAWILGLYIEDKRIWNGIKSGEYAAFSMGGMGTRVPLEE